MDGSRSGHARGDVARRGACMLEDIPRAHRDAVVDDVLQKIRAVVDGRSCRPVRRDREKKEVFKVMFSQKCMQCLKIGKVIRQKDV